MDQHRRHAERVGDQAGMLAAGAAEAVEHIARDVVAALHRDLLDRVRHVLDRDRDEAVGDLFRRASVADLARRAPRTSSRTASASSGWSWPGPKIAGKKSGMQLAEHDIGVGDGERAAAAVAGRARDWRRRNPGRRGSARRRNAGSSRRRPRPCGCASSARACARRRPRSRRRARTRRRSAATSVEVPPMSKPMTWSKPASRPVCAMPTTPPAGPDRIASLPWNRSAAVRPPDDIMNISARAGVLARPAPRRPARHSARRIGER